MNSLITVHWIDGTWKTSTVKHLAERLWRGTINFDNFKDSSAYPINPHKKVLIWKNDLESVCESYFRSMSHHAKQIRACLENWLWVVKARYLDDIRAHFSHLWISEGFLDNCEKKYDFIYPSLKVILILDEEERRKRLNIRWIIDERDEESCTKWTRLQYFQNYVKTKANQQTLLINTWDNNVDSVVDIITHRINTDGI